MTVDDPNKMLSAYDPNITPLEFAQGIKVEFVPCSKRVARREKRERRRFWKFVEKHGLTAALDRPISFEKVMKAIERDGYIWDEKGREWLTKTQKKNQ